jgi:hypothetical protein
MKPRFWIGRRVEAAVVLYPYSKYALSTLQVPLSNDKRGQKRPKAAKLAIMARRVCGLGEGW